MAGISKAERERRANGSGVFWAPKPKGREPTAVTLKPKRSPKRKPNLSIRIAHAEEVAAKERVKELEQQCADYRATVQMDAEVMAKLGEKIGDLEQRLADRTEEYEVAYSMHRDDGRQIAILAAQRDYLIGYANRLLDRFIGVQLLHGLTTIDAAAAFTNAERASAEAELQAIKARHAPPEQPADDAIMPELRERFTDAKQGITEESYLEVSANAVETGAE